MNDTYVDDILTSCNDLTELHLIRSQLVSLLKLGGLTLHKWCSNSELFLNSVPKNQQESLDVHNFQDQTN